MQIYDKTISLPTDSFDILNSFYHLSKEQICIFDIETTGLSPKVSSLYLIGALWYNLKDQQFHVRQWFADDYISEANILQSFSEFLSDFTTIVHYNGSGFDVPYIEKKCQALSLPSPFSNINSLDIFKEIRPLKNLFEVPNLKLFTAEKLTGFLRKDILSGRDCIETYSQFMQKKYFKDDRHVLEREKLLLHNLEDLMGTWHCIHLLSYRCPGQFLSLEEGDFALCIHYNVPTPFPFSAKLERDDGFTLLFEGAEIRLEVHPYTGTLYHFFSNYKDYYYLPAEDTAIHKSVGTYVEKEYRQQAKASNCYTKKEGTFLPVPHGLSNDNRLFFRSEYKSKQPYLSLDDKVKQDSLLFEEILQVLITSI